MHAIIVGGGGYLGQLLADKLVSSGHSVVLYDVAFISLPHVILSADKVRIVKGSVTDLVGLLEAIKGCEVCFHLAAYGSSGASSLDSKKTHEINVNGTKNVIVACEAVGCERLVFTSSIAVVFGATPVFNSDEKAPYLKTFLTSYAESKAKAEKLIRDVARKGRLRTCTLRLRGIYGPGDQKVTNRTIAMAVRGAVIASFEKSQPCLTQYSGAVNTVNALILAANALETKEHVNGEVYNIVDGDGAVQSFGFWYKLFTALEIPLPRYNVPYEIVYTIAYIFEWLYRLFAVEPLLTRFEVNLMALTNTFSIEKARKDLGYQPVNNHSWDSTVEYYKTFKSDNLTDIKRQSKVFKKITTLTLLIIILLPWIIFVLFRAFF